LVFNYYIVLLGSNDIFCDELCKAINILLIELWFPILFFGVCLLIKLNRGQNLDILYDKDTRSAIYGIFNGHFAFLGLDRGNPIALVIVQTPSARTVPDLLHVDIYPQRSAFGDCQIGRRDGFIVDAQRLDDITPVLNPNSGDGQILDFFLSLKRNPVFRTSLIGIRLADPTTGSGMGELEMLSVNRSATKQQKKK